MSMTDDTGIRMIRVCRDPRVYRGSRKRPAATSLAMAAVAFTGAILERYMGRVMGRWAVGFVFRLLPVAASAVRPQPQADPVPAPVDVRLALAFTQRVEAEPPHLRLEPTFPTARLDALPASAVSSPRAVHQNRRAPVEPAREPAPSRPAPAAQGQPAPTGLQPFAPPVPTVDIYQLTDQVIKSIDRRILAERERLGRI